MSIQNNKPWIPPESGDAPKEVKDILAGAYSSCRNSWAKDNPDDIENKGNKTKCAKIAWGAVANAGWKKNASGEWKKSPNNNASMINNAYTIRTEMYDGKEHLVVPVVMMKEGVHSGSQGPIFHSSSELSKMVDAWNGIPAVIYHPKDSDGDYISANSPSVPYVGKIFNTNFSDGALRAEVWLNKEKLSSISPLAAAYIKQQKPLDVSVGVFTDTDMSVGEWNDEAYIGIAKNYRPDHLALLPGETGACSWEDGCGIRVNQKHTDMKNTDKGEFIINSLQDRKNEYTELVEKVRSKIYAMDNDTAYHYTVEIYDDGVIYQLRNRQSGKETFYQQNFTVNDETGEVEFVDDPKKVIRKTEYVMQTNASKTKQQNNKNQKGEQTMEKSKCFIGKVDALIAHERTQFTEEDREMLMDLEEIVLDKMMPKMARTKPAEVEVNEQQVMDFIKSKPEDQVIKLLPEGMQANINAAIQEKAAKREAVITGIMTHEKNEWKKEELTAMSCENLSKIAKMLGTETAPADYSAKPEGGDKQIQSNASAQGEVLLPPGVEA